ncbi:hypothetical protein EVAR_76033_1 [Eumeta japonica]|uniref:Uncharacterized protein n=1 Tax=Eumeta variegata TaxID=151549 RepID=A0A4C1UAI1_EUMVA|nr:hypothetical protein EVAR_76033_1 [Eumeta japonica]
MVNINNTRNKAVISRHYPDRDRSLRKHRERRDAPTEGAAKSVVVLRKSNQFANNRNDTWPTTLRAAGAASVRREGRLRGPFGFKAPHLSKGPLCRFLALRGAGQAPVYPICRQKCFRFMYCSRRPAALFMACREAPPPPARRLQLPFLPPRYVQADVKTTFRCRTAGWMVLRIIITDSMATSETEDLTYPQILS